MVVLESDLGHVVNPFYPLFKLRGDLLRVVRIKVYAQYAPVLLFANALLIGLAFMAMFSEELLLTAALATFALIAARAWLTPVVQVPTRNLRHSGIASAPILFEHASHFVSLGAVGLAGGLGLKGDWLLVGVFGLVVACVLAFAPIASAFGLSDSSSLRR